MFHAIRHRLFVATPTLLALAVFAAAAVAQERTMDDAQRAKIAEQGELIDDAPARPSRLPDLTKGQDAGERLKQNTWPLGPTGLIGYMPGGLKGDQIEITAVAKGSPADGKLQWGDVILGAAGKKFVAGKNMGIPLGNAIIEAERAVNHGKLTLIVWRDNNFLKRNARKDIAGADIDDLFNKAAGDDTLYEWDSDAKQEQAARNQNFKDFPLDGHEFEVTLDLRVLPDYSDTSPYNCPKAAKILEDAWKVLEKQFEVDEHGRGGRGGTLQALALVASGKPEHRKLVRDWVRSPRGRVWHPPTQPDDPMRIPGKSWYMSFTGLDCALYYDATGDEFVLPALTRFAQRTARGQARFGTWGHNWAQPIWNGGELHGMNPGYGALNASGNRCFFLIALAQKLGIKDPEIDLAVGRSQRFFGSYVEKGGIPYGHHAAADTDDSNGKNTGVAFALKLLGDKEGAMFFSKMSTHASFTRRAGHGNDYFWHWSPWAATLSGPRGTIATHRNLRWRFTLCRRFDGGFFIQSPTGGIQSLRDPTATFVLHYSAPFKQTLITGKDADESMFWTDDEFRKLLTMAQAQFNDPQLLERAGPRVADRSTDEVFDFLDVFKPKMRRIYATELAKRYKAGETDILPRLAALLTSDNPRLRGAACRGLAACGPDATLKYMSGVAKLLQDEQEFVRMQAVRTMAAASRSDPTQLALLKAILAEDLDKTMSPNSLPAITQAVLFNNDTTLATKPFEAGFDDELVRDALEALITLDPAGNRPMLGSRKKVWDSDTAVRVAGPLVYSAEEEQIGDQMFSSRRPNTLALLERLGYQEAIDASVSYLRKYEQIDRAIRPRVYYKRGEVVAQTLMRHPAAAKRYLEPMRAWLADKPLALAFKGKDEPDIPLYAVIDAIAKAEDAPAMPRLADEVDRFYAQRLEAAGSASKQIAMCRADLANAERRDYFRKIAAMKHLAAALGGDAMGDLIPYLAHEHWRVRDHARRLAADLAKAHGDKALVEAFATADEPRACGLLATLAIAKTAGGRALAERAMQHDSPAVRGAAIESLFAIAGDDVLDTVFKAMTGAATRVERASAERALLSRRGDSDHADRVRAKAIALLADSDPAARDSLLWVLGNLGGADAVAALTASAANDDDAVFRSAVVALSYCPDPAADKVILDIIRDSRKARGSKAKRAGTAASQGVRRMVVGPDGNGVRPIKEQLDYAEAVLDMVLDDATIAYLGRIRTGRCAYILQRAMRRGAPASAAQAIIHATSDLSDAPEADRKLAVSALIDCIEFIEVTYLRGGASEQLDTRHEAWRDYAMWKAISAEAGKNLLKLNKTDQAPLPVFDDNDLDL